jgi:HAD superfamily hydrolase (TIGR01509 family)
MRFSTNDAARPIIGALIFDFDGLICDTEGALVLTAEEIFASYGATLPMDKWLGVLGTASAEDFWIPWLQEQTTATVNPEHVLNLFRERNEERVMKLEPNVGVHDLLDMADEHGIGLAIASSSPTSWVLPICQNLDIRHRFATIVCREHALRAKPEPDLYIEASKRLATPAANIVAFEDSHNGSLAAIRAQIKCVVAPNALTHGQDFSHATARVSSLAEIIDLDHLHKLVV